MSKIIITWTTYAKLSYLEELDFIEFKWTSKEVKAFILLVNECIENVANGTIEGRKYAQTSVYSIVISKQTTVFYKKYPKKNTIALLLFWNNQKDPKTLHMKLQKMT